MKYFLDNNPEIYSNLICPKCGCNNVFVEETLNTKDAMAFQLFAACGHEWTVAYVFQHGDIYCGVKLND